MPKKGQEEMVFKQYTTSQDYDIPKVPKVPPQKRPEKQPIRRTIHYTKKYIETLFDFKNEVSFDLFHAVKKNAQEDYPEKITKQDLMKKVTPEDIANRTRVLMCPQLALDDIKDMEIRNTVINDMYLSDYQRMNRNMKFDDNKAPLTGKYTSNNPIYVPPLREPIVPPEWRMETCEWDGKQLRTFVDPDKEFWKRRDLYKNCLSCAETKHWIRHKQMKKMLQ